MSNSMHQEASTTTQKRPSLQEWRRVLFVIAVPWALILLVIIFVRRESDVFLSLGAVMLSVLGSSAVLRLLIGGGVASMRALVLVALPFASVSILCISGKLPGGMDGAVMATFAFSAAIGMALFAREVPC